MATVNVMYEMVMFFRNGDLGWDEAYNLVAGSYAAARTAAAKIVSFRMSLSPVDVELVYASVRKLGKPRDGLPVELSYPMAGNSAIITGSVGVKVDSPHDAFYFRSTAVATDESGGEIALAVTGYVRGLPDDVVTESQITLPAGSVPIVVTLPSSEPATVGTPADYAVAVGNFLKVLMGQTRYSKKLPPTSDTPPVLQYRAETWTGVTFRGYTSRKCGRPFTLRPGRAAAR